MEALKKQSVSINVFSLVKYSFFFCLLFVLASASIKGSITPFAFGLFFALVWSNQKIGYLSVLYIFSMYLANPTNETLIIASTTAIVLLVFYFLHKQIKLPISKVMLGVYAFLGQFAYLYFNSGTGPEILTALTSVAIGILFLYACLHILQAVLVHGIIFKLTIDEVICGGVIILALSIGVSAFTVFNTELIRIFAAFIILCATYVYSGTTAILIGNIIGLGAVFYSGDITYLAAFSLFGVVSISFKNSGRVLSILAVIFVDIILGLYFNIYLVYNAYSVLAVIIGGLLFFMISNNSINVLATVLGGTATKTAMRNIVNRSREGLCRRMHEISGIFGEMDRVFKSMVRGVLPAQEVKQMLTQEIVDKVCGDCPERNQCLRAMGEETLSVFNDIISSGFERGKVTILDVPPFLSTRCNRVNTILNSINQLLLSYKQYATMVNNLDSSRVLIAEQLNGVSKIMRNLAEETRRNVTFDLGKEEELVEELTYDNVVCTEAVIYEQNAEISSATLVVRNLDVANNKIEKTTSRICGGKMAIVNTEPSSSPNFSVLTLKTAPKYDVVFGSAGVAKHGSSISGDTFSFIRIGDDKFLLAICDGMGSGETAEKTSNLAISLIENFYKAGFENEIILNSVNKLLSLGNEEVFTALDICVVDLRRSLADFIKVGAPEGFIKHRDSTEIVKTGSLPLGILEEMQPAITKKVIEGSDMVVMFSDGVIDSFNNRDEFEIFVNNIDTINPQTLAENILDKALFNYGNKPLDDCTVIVARIFPRV